MYVSNIPQTTGIAHHIHDHKISPRHLKCLSYTDIYNMYFRLWTMSNIFRCVLNILQTNDNAKHIHVYIKYTSGRFYI